ARAGDGTRCRGRARRLRWRLLLRRLLLRFLPTTASWQQCRTDRSRQNPQHQFAAHVSLLPGWTAPPRRVGVPHDPHERTVLLFHGEIRLLSLPPQPSEAFHSVNCWIASHDALVDWIGPPGRHARVALDTEFVRERTFHASLALVQLAWPEGPVALADVLALESAAPLVALLQDATVTKVMHSASEDLQAFQHTYGALPRPLFDTQIAAAMCGLGPGLSYQRLVAEMLGHALEKGETRSDWMRRPLSDAQLHYAAEDVRYLPEIHAL